jgi:hypothetical protein
MSIRGIIGEQGDYDGLTVAILNEAEGAYRIQIIDGAGGMSSTCAGYMHAAIRARAVELAYAYLLRRDGTAPALPVKVLWKPIRIDLEPGEFA